MRALILIAQTQEGLELRFAQVRVINPGSSALARRTGTHHGAGFFRRRMFLAVEPRLSSDRSGLHKQRVWAF